MISTCLENLEDLGEKGVDVEIIRNTAGIVYGGRLCFTIVRFLPNRSLQECQAPCVSPSFLRAGSSLPSRQRLYSAVFSWRWLEIRI